MILVGFRPRESNVLGCIGFDFGFAYGVLLGFVIDFVFDFVFRAGIDTLRTQKNKAHENTQINLELKEGGQNYLLMNRPGRFGLVSAEGGHSFHHVYSFHRFHALLPVLPN